MSFLLGDEYESSGSSESGDDDEEQEQSVQLDTTDTPTAVAMESGENVTLLPSADSILSSVTKESASFLAPKQATSSIRTVKVFDRLEDMRKDKTSATESLDNRSKVRAARDRDEVHASSTKKRGPPPVAASEKPPSTKREKKNAKERVKGQRLKGQAGIGNDFRAWKSETEMVMRQQFD